MKPLERFKKAWDAFLGKEDDIHVNVGMEHGYNPNVKTFLTSTGASVAAPVFNRIAMDVASFPLRHVRLDENERYKKVIRSCLDECLSINANIDQTGRALIHDAALSLCDEGVVAIVPTEGSRNPVEGSFDIYQLRTARVIGWSHEKIRIRIFNPYTQRFEDMYVDKRTTAIVENPLYPVMNAPNSTLKRLIEKINLLDVIDTKSASGQLDLIIQLPYVAKTELKRKQAEERKKDIVDQLTNSEYGIAYIDGAERVTQLNRSAENNLMAQIEYLTDLFFSQMGLSPSVFNGTASEVEMLNYYNRTIEPILGAFTDSMTRAYLTTTARTQQQAIRHLKDPFKLVPANALADLADKFTRNEIVSPNEFRTIVGFAPSDDPKSDELRNRNINEPQPKGATNGNEKDQ